MSYTCPKCGAETPSGAYCQHCVDSFVNRVPANEMTAEERADELLRWAGPLCVPFELVHQRIKELADRDVYNSELGTSGLILLLHEIRSGQRRSPVEATVMACDLAKSSRLIHLPTEGSKHTAWDRIGVLFGPTTQDPAYSHVLLPDGWSIVTHMGTFSILDSIGYGRERGVGVYGEWPSVAPCARYWVRFYYSSVVRALHCAGVVDAVSGDVLYTSNCPELPRAQTRCETWLSEHYPHWRDPVAYWEES